MTTALTFRSETPADATAVNALIERAFGPGRLVKVSERVRERAHFRADLSICAFEHHRLVGVARMWDATFGGQKVAFLGPLAVDSAARSAGVGAALVNAACDAAKTAGGTAVLLVGDPPFFERLGFSAKLAADVIMPGPVDQRRVLARWLAAEVPVGLSGAQTG